jgi:type II secretory pathway component PulM
MMNSPLEKLSQRDKRALVAGLSLLGVAMLIFLWLLPSLEKIRRLDRAIAMEAKRLEQVRELHKAVTELSDREAKLQEQIKRRSTESFSVASVVESLARDAGVMEQVQYLKPEQGKLSDQFREALVSLKIGDITPTQLVDFLYRLESSERILRVRNLQLRPSPKESTKLDATLTIFTLLPATGPAKPTQQSQEPQLPKEALEDSKQPAQPEGDSGGKNP